MSRATRGQATAAAAALAIVQAVVAGAQSQTPKPAGGPPPLPAMVRWYEAPLGLKYADIVVGKGPMPHDGQTAVMHFTGWLADGMQFDSSRDRKMAFGFKLGAGEVIKGWEDGVRGMREGGKRRLIVPPVLAYGETGIPGLIPPNATLTFDIELIRIVDK
jgi:FKBP-type peptidyl-prolyl cis-trans isomerase